MAGRRLMARRDPLDVWAKELTMAFPDMSKPQLKGLAQWTFGMSLARCCSLDILSPKERFRNKVEGRGREAGDSIGQEKSDETDSADEERARRNRDPAS